jgi:ATP-binding cassette subfamily B protein
VRFFQQQRQWFERLRQANAAYTRANVRASVFAQWSWGGVNAIGLLITLVPFLIGGYLICRGNPAISVGVLVAYYSYLTNLANKVQFVFGGLTYLAQGHPSLVRIRELLDYPEEAEPRRQGIESAPGHTAIEFRDLCYTHPLGGRVLEGFSLRIEPGEKVAITGPSGAGKSTLVRLLLRFLLPSSGELLFGDRPVQDYDLGFYCTFFGYVSQSTHLFGLPIGENIAMGWYGVPEERIREVAGLVRLDPVIRRLPEGYDTVIGSGGTRLSGGQEQRLALARALVREPEVLVLDEFTSGLDREVEDAILDDLFRVFADQSILCITHSESVAARFDRVVRLDPVGGTAPGPAAAPDPAAHGGR